MKDEEFKALQEKVKKNARRPLKASDVWDVPSAYPSLNLIISSKLPVRNKAGWRTVGGKKIYFRSIWEIRYALFLEFQKDHNLILGWDYEPKTFWFPNIKRGVVSYKPDFYVISKDSDNYWVEVKGYMDAKSKTKIKRFRKFYPKETLLLIDKNWFSKNNKHFKGIIPQWE
jgi:hypothetical protein